MRKCDAPQRSFEWFACRAGRVTASRMADVMSVPKINKDGKPRGGLVEMAKRKRYRYELRAERLTGEPSQHFVSVEMKRGNVKESHARIAYERLTGRETELAGFLFHPLYDWSGASPDSLVGINGGLELKSPATITHLGWIDGKVVPPEYQDQMYWNIECAEVEWWDFFSFDDRVQSQKSQGFLVRLYRDEKRQAAMREKARQIDAEVEFMIAEMGEESMLPPIEAFMTQTSGWHEMEVPTWETPEQFIDALADEVAGMNEMVP